MSIRISQDQRICFIGDSFVQGVGDPEHRGWVGRVLAAHGPDLTAFNLGVRRNTSDDVLARCWAEFDPRTAPGSDHRLVISFGTNDTALEDGRPRVAPERTLENLTTLLTEAAGGSVGVLVVGPPPVVSFESERQERLEALADGLAEVCKGFDVPFVPVTRALAADPVWTAEALAGDGAHPGAGGYARAAELILAGGFSGWLTEAQAARR